MDYYEFDLTYTSAMEPDLISDVLAAELAEIGFESFTQHEAGMQAYIPANLYHADAMATCLQNFPLEGVQIHHSRRLIEDRNWNEVWEQNYFQPVRIDDKCLLRAPFHPAGSGFAYEIIINPKMAFGTGNHETTYLMIKEILGMTLDGKEALDMGCGTAVLAILAAKKNAGRVVAIDIDEWAYRNAVENCELNHTPHIQVVQGDATAIAQTGAFDCIFANINRNILLNDICYYASALKHDGALIMSGFYKEDIPAIESACRQMQLAIVSVSERNNWVAVRAEKG
jgi:ribosomal protein L11 methyltransferase